MSPPQAEEPASPESGAFAILATSARLLFENGQTTRRMRLALEDVARAFGGQFTISPAWNALRLELKEASGTRSETIPSRPTGVDMSRVAATMRLLEQLAAGRATVGEAPRLLAAVQHSPPVNLVRFACLAGAGAAALAAIFGAGHLYSLVIIAISAAAGAFLRRWLAGRTRSLLIQPFAAALLAGIVGAIAARLHLSSSMRLIAVCPCMVLVPGPHILNGALDLVRMRLRLGLARVIYASLLTGAICAGLVLGLALAGAVLPPAAPSLHIPLIEDVLAAGVAVAAYGTFFNMSRRLIPIPVAVGMLAHAARCWALTAGASGVLGAFIACVIVGFIMTPISRKLHLPFAGLAFSSVVSLIPGVYLFRMAGGFYDLLFAAPQARHTLFLQSTTDGLTAISIVAAMTIGLIAPKIALEFLFPEHS